MLSQEFPLYSKCRLILIRRLIVTCIIIRFIFTIVIIPSGGERYDTNFGRKTFKPIVVPPVGRGLDLKAQVTMRHKIEEPKEKKEKRPAFRKRMKNPRNNQNRAGSVAAAAPKNSTTLPRRGSVTSLAPSLAPSLAHSLGPSVNSHTLISHSKSDCKSDLNADYFSPSQFARRGSIFSSVDLNDDPLDPLASFTPMPSKHRRSRNIPKEVFLGRRVTYSILPGLESHVDFVGHVGSVLGGARANMRVPTDDHSYSLLAKDSSIKGEDRLSGPPAMTQLPRPQRPPTAATLILNLFKRKTRIIDESISGKSHGSSYKIVPSVATSDVPEGEVLSEITVIAPADGAGLLRRFNINVSTNN